MIGVLAHRLDTSVKQCRHALAIGSVLVAGLLLSGCVTSTYVTANGAERVAVVEEQTEYRTVMTPSDRKSTRLNSSHSQQSRMPSSA